MATEYHLLAELELAFDHLVEASLKLIENFDPERYPGWQLDNTLPMDQWIKLALTDYWYQDGQDGRTTRPYIGLVAADEPLMKSVRLINHKKTEVARIISQIRKQAPAMVAEIKATLPFRHPLLHDHLMGAGLARLHLKQCWRQIPLASAAVSKVRMAWYSSGRSIRKLSVAEAEAMLTRLDSDAPHVRIQYQKLAALPSNEILAQVQSQAPLMRANLFYREPLEDGRMRQAMNVSLPLFIPMEDKNRIPCLPAHNYPAPEPPAERMRERRSDARLENEPYLPSLRIHRYRSLDDH